FGLRGRNQALTLMTAANQFEAPFRLDARTKLEQIANTPKTGEIDDRTVSGCCFAGLHERFSGDDGDVDRGNVSAELFVGRQFAELMPVRPRRRWSGR